MNEIWKNISLINLTEEEWLDVPGFEGLYQASSMGRIKSLPKLVTLFNGGGYYTKEKILKQRKVINKDYPGRYYLQVALFVRGERYEIPVHRLIGLTYIPNPENKPCINHKKGITMDNRVTEIEWATYSENIQHAYDFGLNTGPCKGRFGVYHPGAKKVQCLFTGRILSVKEAAEWLNVSTTHMSSLLKGIRTNWTNFIYYGT